MIQRVHKYILSNPNHNIIRIPKNAQFLKVAIQGYDTVLYALVDTQEELENVHFLCIGTGYSVTDELQENEYVIWIDTVIEDNGVVRHVFEIRKDND